MDFFPFPINLLDFACFSKQFWQVHSQPCRLSAGKKSQKTGL